MKKNNRSTEDVLRLVAKDNNFKYVEPQNRVPRLMKLTRGSMSGQERILLIKDPHHLSQNSLKIEGKVYLSKKGKVGHVRITKKQLLNMTRGDKI